MTRASLLAGPIALLAWSPVRALAASGVGSDASWGDTEVLSLVGIAAAFALHHLTRRRTRRAARWQWSHVADHLPVLRLGERLHGLHVRDALDAVLHARWDRDLRSAAPSGHPRRVLIVDDDSDIRAAIAEILASEGFAVIEAADGLEGLRLARDERPDLVLLDLMMPRMDGYEFRAAQQADARLASIPVVVISASVPEKVPAFSAVPCLHKPFDLSVLLATVDRCAAAA